MGTGCRQPAPSVENGRMPHVLVFTRNDEPLTVALLELAKDAMDLFIRSLPLDCSFSIISFGSNFDSLCHEDGGDVLVCQDESRNYAIEEVKAF